MSTYWYFECTQHDPPLRSEEEFTQHTGDSYFDHGIRMASERPISDDFESSDYFVVNAARFLRQHPKCELAIVSEYGERRTGLPELRKKQ